MKTLIYNKYFGIILLTIILILPSCEWDKEIIKELKAPAWIEADARLGGIVTLTWAPVDEAVKYYIHCGEYTSDYVLYNSELISSEYRIGSSETTTFSHYNKNWERYYKDARYYRVKYGVCMVDELGNVSPLTSIRVEWPKQ